MSNYKVVFIESPYDYYEHSLEVRELMQSIFKLKLEGYKAYHEFGIMPVASDDFFCNHLVICQETSFGLIPKAAFKSMTNRMCDKYRVTFPIIEHNLKGVEAQYQEHIDEIKNWLSDKRDKQQTVGYNFGWTICPNVKDKAERKFLVNFSMAVYYFYYNFYNVNHIITAAFKDFKVNKIQEEMGFKYLSQRGKELTPFKGAVFNGKEAFFMYLEDLSFPLEFQNKALFLKKYWDEKIVFSEETYEQGVEIAA